MFNFLQNIPENSREEFFQTVFQNEKVKVERIVSYGQTTPEDFWYDQDEDEFVVILSGSAIIKYENGEIFYLAKGDFLYIKAHQKHKVTYTENPTIWLAVFIV